MWENRSFWQRLRTQITWYQLVTLAGGTIAILLAVYTLSYIWWPYGRDDSSRFWNRMVSMGYIPQTITICSALIRTSVSFHSVLCCGMIASISLTHRQVLYQDAAAMSIARSDPSGPFSIIPPLFSGTTRTINMHRSSEAQNITPNGIQRYVCFALVIVVAVLSVITQFTSTILLSDMGTTDVPGRLQDETVTYRQLKGSDFGRIGLGTQSPSAYPIFAEQIKSSPRVYDDGEQGTLVDTGALFRAFLPFSKLNRSTIISYRGPAYVVDSHVLCFPPTVEVIRNENDYSSLNLGLLKRQDSPEDEPSNYGAVPRRTTTRITGLLRPSVLDRYLNSGNSSIFITEPANFTLRFNCTIPLSNTQSHVLCEAHKPTSTSTYTPIPTVGATTKNISDSALEWLLVIETNSGNIQWKDVIFTDKPRPVYTGEWAAINNTANNVTLKLSLCMSSFGVAAYSNVTVKGNGNYAEPDLSIALIDTPHTPIYNTSLIKNQLGVFGNNHSPRNVLNLTSVDIPQKREMVTAASKLVQNNNEGIDMSCATIVHPILSSLYYGVLNDTKQVPLAIQAFMTVITSMDYYSRRTFGNQRAQATVQRRSKCTIPTRMVGFFVVIGSLAVHFMLVLTILWMFSRDPRNIVGQSWQTIAQLHQGKAQDFLDKASVWDDDHVKQWMKEEGGSCSHSIVDVEGPNKAGQFTIGFVDSTPGRLEGFSVSVESFFRSIKEFLTRWALYRF